MAEIEIDDGRTRLHWWLVDLLEGQAHLKNDEHSELGWFTINEIISLKEMHHEDRKVFVNFTSTPLAE